MDQLYFESSSETNFNIPDEVIFVNFKNCNNITSINLSKNNNLKYLEFINCKKIILPENLNKLENLYYKPLNENENNDKVINQFIKINSLKMLYLKNYNNNIFENLNNIEEIYFKNCNITSLKFPTKNKLKLIHFIDCKNIILFDDNLINLIELSCISSNKNNIINFNIKSSINLKILTSLCLYNCNINNIPDNLINLNNLCLNNCQNIHFIPNTLINIKNLDITNCQNIQFIPKELINIKNLYLTNISFDLLPDELINLKILFLEDCKNILTIPDKYINLKHLKIKNSEISTISDNLINLKCLYLEECKQIKTIPEAFNNLKELYIFNCNVKIPEKYKNILISKNY